MRKKLAKLLPVLLLFFAILFVTDSAKAATSVLEEGNTFTLTDDGTLTVKKNQFSYRNISDKNRKYVEKIIFAGDVTMISSDVIGRYLSSSGRHDNDLPNVTEIVVGSNVKTIGPCAFSGLSWVKKITLPDSVTSIGSYAFEGCSAISEIHLSPELTEILSYTFGDCTNLQNINLGNTKVTKIETGAFSNTTSLEKITLPNTLKTMTLSSYMERGVFQGSGLKSISIPKKLGIIPKYCFRYCQSLQSVTFQEGLSGIGEEAFRYTALTSVTFPTTLNYIAQNAFTNSAISQITFRGVTPAENIYKDAFNTGLSIKGFYPASGLAKIKEKEFSNTITWSEYLGGTWKQDAKGWWFSKDNGTYPKNKFEKIGTKWYYFDANGYMVTGWKQVSKKWYYFNASGIMLTGMQKIGLKWYYLGTDGAMVTGLQKIGSKFYFFGTDGVMTTGLKKIGSAWYYFGPNGYMMTGLQKINAKYYYFRSNGTMVIGWFQIGSKWYYFDNGALLVNTKKVIGKKTYIFAKNGVCINK